jgi:hypothetical protein
MEAQLRLNILPGYPIYLGSFIFERESGWLESLNLWSIDPEDHSNPSTIGLSAGCHEVSLKKMDIGQFTYMKYNTKGSIGMPNNKTVSTASLSISTLSASRDNPIMKTHAIDRMNIQKAYTGYLSFNNFPSEFTKIPSLFKDTFCLFEIIYGVTKRLTKDIDDISNMLDNTNPVTNMSQNIRFQKLSFDRSLFFMVFGVFYIYRFHYIIL